VIDVTRRSIEETAAQILDLLDRRVEGQAGNGGRNGRAAAGQG
jgi:hypothetical protein